MKSNITLLLCLLFFVSNSQVYTPYIKTGHNTVITDLKFDKNGSYLLSKDSSQTVILWDFFLHSEISKITYNKQIDLQELKSSFFETSEINQREHANTFTFKLKKKKIKCFKKGRLYSVIPTDKGEINSFSQNSNSNIIAYSFSEKTVFIRDVNHADIFSIIQCNLTPTKLCFHPLIPNLLVIGYDSGGIEVYNIDDKSIVFQLESDIFKPISIERRNKQVAIKSLNSFSFFNPYSLAFSYLSKIPSRNFIDIATDMASDTLTKIYGWDNYSIYSQSIDTSNKIYNQTNTKFNNKIFFPIFFLLVNYLGGIETIVTTIIALPQIKRLEKAFYPSIQINSNYLFLNSNDQVLQIDLRDKKILNRYTAYGNGVIYFKIEKDHLLIYRPSGYVTVYNLKNNKAKHVFYTSAFEDFFLVTSSDSAILIQKQDNKFNILSLNKEGKEFSYTGKFVSQSANVIYLVRNDSIICYSLITSNVINCFKQLKKTQPRLILKSPFNDTDLMIFYEEEGIIDYVDSIGKLLATIFYFNDGQFLIMTPDNYFYASSKNTIGRITMINKDDNRTYPLDLFEEKFNRPDLVLQRINFSDTFRIKLYAIANKIFSSKYSDSLKIYNYSKLPLSNINFKKSDNYIVNDSILEVELQFESFDTTLAKINLSINNNSVFPFQGIDLSKRNLNHFDTIISIKLSVGDNLLKPFCQDKNLNSSISKIYYRKGVYQVNPKLFFLGIGARKYSDSSYNLDYSRDDILNLFSTFKSQYNDEMVTDTLFDNNVTTVNIRKSLGKLSNASENDLVVIAYSGHGLFDSSFNYFLGTYGLNFKNPTDSGFNFNDFSNCLDTIRSRKKIVFVDACYSGERFTKTIFSNLLDQNEISDSLAEKAFYLMNETYNDFLNQNGTIMITASRANEKALEGNIWESSAFTNAIVKGLKTKAADFDKNSSITVQELKQFVSEKVVEYSGGRQKPTSRKDNIEYNWIIY